MAISYKDGVELLVKLNNEVSVGIPRAVLFLFDNDAPPSFQLINGAVLIEYLLRQGTKEDTRKAKRIARLLDTLLREGDDLMRNEVLSCTCEAFTYPPRADLPAEQVAAALPRYIRQAYLYEMGMAESPFLENWQVPKF